MRSIRFHKYTVKPLSLSLISELSPITADPISELVTGNRVCHQEIEGKISLLHSQLASLQGITSKVETSILSLPSLPLSHADAARGVTSNAAGVSSRNLESFKECQ